MHHSVTALPNQSDTIKTYENLSQNTLEIRDKKEVYTQVSNSPKSKYKVTLEFLGTADSQEVEEEIITILKRQFLSTFTSGISNTQALQSIPGNKKGGTKE